MHVHNYVLCRVLQLCLKAYSMDFLRSISFNSLSSCCDLCNYNSNLMTFRSLSPIELGRGICFDQISYIQQDVDQL